MTIVLSDTLQVNRLMEAMQRSEAEDREKKRKEGNGEENFKIQALAWSFYNQNARREVNGALEEVDQKVKAVGATAEDIEKVKATVKKVLENVVQRATKIRQEKKKSREKVKEERKGVICLDAYFFLTKRAENLSNLNALKNTVNELEGNAVESDASSAFEGELKELEEPKMMAVAWLVYQAVCENRINQTDSSIRAIQLLLKELLTVEGLAKESIEGAKRIKTKDTLENAKKQVREFENKLNKFLSSVQEAGVKIVNGVIKERESEKRIKRTSALMAAVDFEEEKASIRSKLNFLQKGLVEKDPITLFIEAHRSIELAEGEQSKLFVLKQEAQAITLRATSQSQAFEKIAMNLAKEIADKELELEQGAEEEFSEIIILTGELTKLSNTVTKAGFTLLKAQIEQSEEGIKGATAAWIEGAKLLVDKANLLKAEGQEKFWVINLRDNASEIFKMVQSAEQANIKVEEAKITAQIQNQKVQEAIKLAMASTKEPLEELEIAFQQEEVEKARADFETKFQEQAQLKVAVSLAYNKVADLENKLDEMKLTIEKVIHELSRITVDVADHPDYIKQENEEALIRTALEGATTGYNIAKQKEKDLERAVNEAKDFLVEERIRANVRRMKLLTSKTTDI